MGNSVPEIITEKAIYLTNSNRIKWQAVSDYILNNENTGLDQFILNENKTFYGSIVRYGFRKTYSFNGNALCINDSFCAEFEGGLIYLFSVHEHPEIRQAYILAVQGSKEAGVSKVNNETIAQDHLEKLYSLAKEQVTRFNNVNNLYIAKLLNINEE